MTEAEWLTCDDALRMLPFIGRVLTDSRKVRLLACACCRAVWDDTWPQRSREAIVSAELFANGMLTESELNDFRSLACQSAQNEAVRQSRMRFTEANLVLVSRLTFAADAALKSDHIVFKVTVSYPTSSLRADEEMKAIMPPILKDIFGNPFCPVTLDPSWLTSDVRLLSTSIYADRAFDRLPILADALQDAGCDRDDVLNHLRGDGPHVLGCWALDLVLGKS
ncbi:hypothetical protein R5W24_006194 [Gemmata sp. JC717]|uniref:hypothetical protein n=1 Tax=Gemmata algarum TaxID=2975278 RepID=UPI0021BB4B93|nr:hypothetical protein [Gemmata algarum]MDY3557010.1 hypothetical protein [Gemmata algarum]